MTFDLTQHMYARYRPNNLHLERIKASFDIAEMCDELPHLEQRLKAFEAQAQLMLNRLHNRPDEQDRAARMVFAKKAEIEARIRHLESKRGTLCLLSDLHSRDIELRRAA